MATTTTTCLSSATLMLALLLSGCGGDSASRPDADTNIVGGSPAVTDPNPPLPATPLTERKPLPPTTTLRKLVDEMGLRGDPEIGRELPSIDDPVARLGRKLFFTKALGGDLDTACASCHHPMLGGGDDLSLPIGVGAVDPDLLGPGRRHSPTAPHYDGGPTVPRNAPTTFNAGLWDRVMFHDGRVEALDGRPGRNGSGTAGITTPDAIYPLRDPDAGPNLVTAQARFPMTSPEEMLGFSAGAGLNSHGVRRLLSARLGNFGDGAGVLPKTDWEAEFRAAFHLPDEPVETLITSERITYALGEYQRSQRFVETPWKAWVTGDDDAIDEAAKRGALLFLLPPDQGGAGCAACHGGDAFTDEGFHVIAAPQIGRGKGDGPDGLNDYGRFRVTGNPDDKFAFRTPSLLNVTATGPWSHAGAYTSLKAMIRHHLDPERAIQNYDYSQIDPSIRSDHMTIATGEALRQLKRLQQAGRSKLKRISLSEKEIDDLEAFLRTLTDPCVESRDCLAPWLPDDDNDPDGLRLKARDAAGKLL